MFRALLLSAAVVLLSLTAQAADDPPKPDPKPDNPASIEVYRVKNADLNEAQVTFAALVGRPRRSPTATGPGGKAPRGGPGGGTGFTRPATDDSTLPDVVPSGTAPATVIPRAVADPRTRSLVVRGTARDQQVAADLVAILDTAEGKPLPPLKAIKAFRLQHIDATDLVSLLQMLDPAMTYRLAPLGSMKLLLANGTDEQMKELADAVKKLDIPSDAK